MTAGNGAYDHVIVGAGVSGVLLARRLLASADASARSGSPRVLLVDPQPATDKPMTLALWAAGPTALDAWTIGSWDALTVVGHGTGAQRVPLGEWRYTALDWRAARSDLLAGLSTDPRLTLLPGAVSGVRDGIDDGAVQVAGRWIRGSWVYDSRPPDIAPWRTARRGRAVRLLQVFRGAWVESDSAGVDRDAATLLDFAGNDGPDLGFSYVLPVAATRAMVMAVRVGADPAPPDPLPAVRRKLGDRGWRVVAEEGGVTPLVTPPRPRAGNRVLRIGARGGRVRPSTGYALTRILDDTEAIAASLERHGHPFASPPDSRRQRVMDSLWLHAQATERAALEHAYLALFKRAPVDVVLRFLDGQAGPADAARIVAAVPPLPFLRAAVRLTLGR